MSDQLRIAIVGLHEGDRNALTQVLVELGHSSIQHVSIGNETELVKPIDIVILSLREAPRGQDAFLSSPNGLPTVPIIIVRDRGESSVGNCAAVWGYVSSPFYTVDVALALSVATGHFREVVGLQNEISELRNLLHDRKIIERAKGIVMRQTGADESTAFKQLQKIARQRSRKMVEIAQGIIDSNEAVETLKRR